MKTPTLAELRERQFEFKDRNPRAMNLVREVSNWLNRWSDSGVAYDVAFQMTVGEHRTLQQSLMRELVVPIIDLMADEYIEGFTDARNQAACKLAWLIREKVKDEYGWPPPLPFI